MVEVSGIGDERVAVALFVDAVVGTAAFGVFGVRASGGGTTMTCVLLFCARPRLAQVVISFLMFETVRFCGALIAVSSVSATTCASP